MPDAQPGCGNELFAFRYERTLADQLVLPPARRWSPFRALNWLLKRPLIGFGVIDPKQHRLMFDAGGYAVHQDGVRHRAGVSGAALTAARTAPSELGDLVELHALGSRLSQRSDGGTVALESDDVQALRQAGFLTDRDSTAQAAWASAGPRRTIVVRAGYWKHGLTTEAIPADEVDWDRLPDVREGVNTRRLEPVPLDAE